MNYLPGSFGLKIFHAPVIKRETIERKIERKLKDKIIVPSKEQKEIPVKRKVPVARYVAAAASVLLIVSLVIVSLQTNFLKNIHIAGMNPFAAGEKPLYQANEEALPEMDIIKDDVSSLLASNRNDTTRYLHIVINGNVPIVVSLQDETVVKKETKIKMHASGRYHIIGGAFSVARNAEKFKKKLEKLGYDAFIIEKKLQFVSYGSYATREEALQALEKIKAVQNDVWLMTN
jgi:septal ring-binding cell division protein DamX